MKKYYDKQLISLKQVSERLDYTKTEIFLNACLNAIKNNKKIIITSLGKNVPICEKFVGTLNSLGISAAFMHTNSAIHGDLGIIKEGDVVMVLSKSGETDETIYLCNLLKDISANSWLLTCVNNSTCSKLINDSLILNIDDEGDPWNLIPNNSSLSFLVFLQSVSMYFVEELKISIDVFKRNHPGGSIGKKLSKM